MGIVLTASLRLFDLFLVLLAVPAAWVMWLFRRVGAARLPITRNAIISSGVFPIRNHYYEPLFDMRHLRMPPDTPRILPGLNLRIDDQLSLLAELNYATELVELRWDHARDTSDHNFALQNGSFESGDAEFLYQFLRHIKPSRVFEIGSGNSTKVVRQALLTNQLESQRVARHVCIEPYEMPFLDELGIEVLRDRVESMPLSFFQELQAGDLLFVDSSHMIRPQGDVLCEYLQILPSLKPGVFVHVHDIFTPRDYLQRWLCQDVRFWNEQYLLEAMLACSTRYQVVAALNYLRHDHFDKLRTVCPFLTEDREPGSFYLKVSAP